MAERKSETETTAADTPARVEESTYTREELVADARGFGSSPEAMAGALALFDGEYANRRRTRLTPADAEAALGAFAKRPITD